MAGLSLGGVNLDVQGLVAQLMQVESAPLFKLQAKESKFQSQLSAFGRLKSALSAFQTSMSSISSLDKFESYKVFTSESETDQSFTAKVDSNAVGGNFSIEVIDLAVANKLGSTTAFGDTSSAISTTANLDVSDGTNSFSLDINGMSLEEIRDAINAEASSSDVGVSASIIKESDTAYQFVLSATETGEANEIQVTSTGDAVTQLDLTEKQTAQDASVTIDNSYTVSSATNTVTDAISGVSLNLLKQSTAAADLKIEQDIDGVKESLGHFVSAFNTMYSTINALKESGLEGDSTLNSILFSVRNEFNNSAGLSGAFNYLSEVGITSNAQTGELELDSATLEEAVDTDYEAISQLFANDDQGIAFRLEAKMEDYLKYDGLIKARETGLQSRIDSNEDAQLRMEYRLEKIELRYLKQFSSLDRIISESNSTSSYLSQQLANLPSFSSK